MAIDFNLLYAEFADKAQQLLENCKKQGYNLVPSYGLRTLESQAKLWRQSRPTVEIQAKITDLKKHDCDYLAHVIDTVGPSSGRWATNAIPGLSWHNWGQAMDVLWIMDNGKVCEDGRGVGYKVYGQEALKLGLRWGGNFSTPDAGHVQLNQKEIPALYDIKYVNDHFANKQ